MGVVLLIGTLAIVGGCARANAPAAVQGKDKPPVPRQEEKKDVKSSDEETKGSLVIGTVIDVRPDRILVQTAYHGNVTLHLSPETKIWDGLWLNSIPTESGDDVTATVRRRADGSLYVEQLYINIVNLYGSISNLEKTPEGLQFRMQQYSRSVTVEIDRRTGVLNEKGRTVAFGDQPVDLRNGQTVRVIGRRLRDGSVVAATLIPWENPREQAQ